MSRVLPILFNTDMVRAILDGRKTVTRRLIKPQPQGCFEVNEEPLYIYDTDDNFGRRKPPYQPGDVLYVRETWSEWTGGYLYKAGTPPFAQAGESAIMTWHPSLHMPKEAARIWLKVTDVRVERLQDISYSEITKEGVHPENIDNYFGAEKKQFAFEHFEALWDSTIKKLDLDRYGWDANPWVWVIEFERCEKPENV